MAAPHYRKIELQSPADFTYLYANTVALSRQKLDLHLPLPQQTMKPPIQCANAINGIDSSSPQFPFPAAFTAPTEQIEYEPFDTELAARVAALYAQLESLNTTVAQQRRDAPRRAAKEYAAQLKKIIQEEDEDMDEAVDLPGRQLGEENEGADAVSGGMGGDSTATETGSALSRRDGKYDPAWRLQVELGTEAEQERWRSGDVAAVYEDALRMLLRLQGEDGDGAGVGGEDNALASTVGKAERAGRAADVVENMLS
ncbi:Kinetochore Mis14 [Penicillium sp. DV-2018c]|nr:Kinetochore Mis14 [Penicillium sp. DV-2018c]